MNMSSRESSHQAASGESRLFCSRCQAEVDPVLWESGPHVRADCPLCGRYIRFVKRSDADLVDVIRNIAPRLSEHEREQAIKLLQQH